MRSGKKRTAVTITLMTILAIVILIVYYYWANRTVVIDTKENNFTEVQKYINKDLDSYYPQTPKEVVNLFADMTKTLYNNPDDKDIKPLALKMRELYDEEFLSNNPEEAYVVDIYSELALWMKNNKKIEDYQYVKEDQSGETELDGVKYATEYISFMIQEQEEYTEIWAILLRQDSKNEWKILGWQVESEVASEDQ